MNIHICQRCGTKFERRTNGNEYKYCSFRCSRLKVIYNPEVLEMLAARGEKARVISETLGYSKGHSNAVRNELQRHGWYQMWLRARYKKCRDVEPNTAQ